MLADLLRRTAARYQEARRLVLAEHPDVSKADFEKLVAATVQRLANQDVHLDVHLNDDDPEQPSISPTTTATGRRQQSVRSRRSPTP